MLKNKVFVKSFEVRGLFGYKNIQINFQNRVKITAAENGNGKTTVLNIFYAVLNGDSFTLRKYDFDQIIIIFGDDEIVNLNYSDLFFNDKNYHKQMYLFEDYEEIESFLQRKTDYIKRFSKEKIYLLEKSLYPLKKFDVRDVRNLLDSLNIYPISMQFVRQLYEYTKNFTSSNLYKIKEKVESTIDVLYFPTYRRIDV